MKEQSTDTGKGLVGVDRTVLVIEAVRVEGNPTLADVARATGLSEPTVLRYLAALRKHRVIAKDAHAGTYRLGARLREWGDSAPWELDPRVVAAGPLRRLADELGETVELAAVEADQVTVIAAAQSGHAIGKVARLGEREPWHSTSVGKAILSHAEESFCERILGSSALEAFTDRTQTDASAIRADIARVAERGYAVDDEESESGLRCIGVAVRDGDGRYTMAVSASGPVYRMGAEREAAIAERVAQAAAEIEEGLGLPPVTESLGEG